MQNTKMSELITKLVLKRCGTTTKTCVTYGNLHLAYEYQVCTSGGVYVPLVEFMYLVFTRMLGESYHR